jgi:hypothetical protein
MEAVRNKRAFYGRWLAGEFGNRPRAWDDEADLAASGYEGRCSIRYKRPDGGRWKRFGVAAAAVPAELDRLVAAGAERHLFTFNESMPDGRLVVQGELARGPWGLSLRYDTVPGRSMPEAMAAGREVTGVAAVVVLRHLLDPDDLDAVAGLADRHEGHVVEFGAYEVAVGVVPGRRAVIWELRAY